MRQLAKSRRQPNAEEAEDESPGPKILDRRDKAGIRDLVEAGNADAARYPRDDQRREDESDHELREAPPDLRGIRTLAGCGDLPPRRRDDRQHEGPDTDPDITADDLHQREGPDGLVARSGDAAAPGIAGIGLRRCKAGRVGKLRRADPSARYASVKMERVRDERQGEDHHDRPENHDSDGNRRIFLLCTHRAGDRDRGGNAADSAAGAERRRELIVEAKPAAYPEDHKEGRDRYDRRLENCHGPGPDDQGERQRRAEQHNPGLDIELDAKPRIEPARQRRDIRDEEAQHKRHERRLEVVVVCLVPLSEREDHDGQDVEQHEGREELARLVAERRKRDGEGHGPEDELRNVAQNVVGEMCAELRKRRPFGRRDCEPADARAIGEKNVGGEHKAEAEPDCPPILLQPQFVPPGALTRRRTTSQSGLNLAHS